MRSPVLRFAMLLPGVHPRDRVLSTSRHRRGRGLRESYYAGCEPRELSAICLRACYAMSGIDLAYGAICLRACYVMSDTFEAYGPTKLPYSSMHAVLTWPTRLRVRYAMSVLISRMVLPGDRLHGH
eukprot:2453823-Rhodomonas_salina.1